MVYTDNTIASDQVDHTVVFSQLGKMKFMVRRYTKYISVGRYTAK